MKDYIKNNPFLAFVIIVIWIFFLGISIAEKGFFIKNIAEPIGTTIFFIGIGKVIKTNKEEKKIENIKEINPKEAESMDNNKKMLGSNKGKVILKKYIYSLLGVDIIITMILFWIYKPKFELSTIALSIFFCFICEVAICGVMGTIIKVFLDYVKICRKKGVLKATVWLILLILMVVLVVYNKDAKLFK